MEEKLGNTCLQYFPASTMYVYLFCYKYECLASLVVHFMILEADHTAKRRSVGWLQSNEFNACGTEW
jgi:hypothetical protein